MPGAPPGRRVEGLGPGATPERTPLWVGLVAGIALLGVGGIVRALRIWGDFATWAHWDDVRNAVPAAQILDGFFSVHQVGVEYYGATGAYPLAVLFALLGPSTVVLDLFCLGLASAVAWTGYLVARRVLPWWPALLTALVLAGPPLLLNRWAMSGNFNYPLNQLIGNLILLGTHTIFYRGAVDWARLLIVGVVVGLGWWNNPLVVVYCAPFAFLALRTGLVWRARFWSFPLGVVLGGLPDWVYEVASYPSSRLILHGSGGVAPTTVGERTVAFLSEVAFELAGARARELAEVEFVPPTIVQAALVAFAVLVVARAVFRDRRELRWLIGFGGERGTGLGMLWALVVANLAVTLLTQRELGVTYFLPLYSVLPLWYGECFAWLWARRPAVGVAALGAVVGCFLWSNWAVTLGRGAPLVSRWSGIDAEVRPLIDWLDARGIRYVYYAVPLPSFEFTFLTGMRIVAAHPWHEPVVQHGQAVDAQLAPPIVVEEDTADVEGLVPTLRGLGQTIHETKVGKFRVLEATPTSPMGFTPIVPDGWTVSASHRPFEAGHLIDRDAATGWSTGRQQAPDQWLQVDLGVEHEVARVDLLSIDWQEVPAGLRVDWSRDGRAWEEAVAIPTYWGPMFVSEHHPFLRVRRGRVQAVFRPVRARFLRLAQTGQSGRSWAARELFAYRPAPAGKKPPPPDGELASGLDRLGVRMVYANHWLSARVLAEGGRRGRVSALESNINLNSYRHTLPEPTTLERFRPFPDRAVLVGSDGDAAGIRRTLESRGMLGRASVVGPYQLFHLTPPAPAAPLDRAGWKATANRAGADAGRILDGDRRTSWRAEDDGAELILDLGGIRRVTGVRMQPGSRDGNPAAFSVEGSPDGISWQRLGSLAWSGPLYWTGYELLRNGRAQWAVTFPAVPVRQLRLRPAAPGREWVIEEIELF